MTFASNSLSRRILFSLALSLAAGAAWAEPPPAAPPPAPKLRIKNAQSIRVALDRKRHEPASGIRPEKAGMWNVIPVGDLAGASAELVDVTPNAPHSRWVVDVQEGKLVLDTRRFLPTHVYQLDVRKEKKLIGSALVYLYPPPVEAVGHVKFEDEDAKKKGKDDGDVVSVPKGDL